jgi:exopolyphosphatase / guanosine-5'-triphosphate,3'-diphosphate pyrophosphatase
MDDIAAAIDIGSNTVHMLAGRWRDGRVDWVDEASEMVGLAEDVYGTGTISPARLVRAVEVVERLARRARDHGARTVLLIATAAVRDASNAADLGAAVQQRTGIEMRTIGGAQEAALTFRGASAGEEAPSLQVCDVGGGSTEVIRAEAGRIILQTSLPIGSARLSRLFTSDPPTAGEVARAHEEAEHVLAALPPWKPGRLLVTGGTATTLARVAGGTGRRYVMAADELARIRAFLTVRTSAEIAAAHRIGVLRARLLPGGTAIIAALREAAGADELVLTAAGLRDGLLIEFFETRREKEAT